MKFAIVIPDGCSDEPQAELGGRTPLQAANIPHMDEIANMGIVGTANHVPDSFTPGSAVANMSLLGFDPNRFFTGRAPIEAVAQNIKLENDEWAIRCNLVTTNDDGIMKSFTAEQISSEEARHLLVDLQIAIDEEFADSDIQFEFVPGVSYRNLVICRTAGTSDLPFSRDTKTLAPHDLTDQRVSVGLPSGPGAELLNQIMTTSRTLFTNHFVNEKRIGEGLLPATEAWLWGLGQRPALPNFSHHFGHQGAMVTAVDLLRGLARLLGWSVCPVPGATGYFDTDYAAKSSVAIDALSTHDIVCIHIEATDEASHEGNCEEKIRALENIDRLIVGPMLEYLGTQDDWRIMVTPDHPTLLRTKTHSHGPVPFAICGSGIPSANGCEYSESSASSSPVQFDRGFELMPCLLDKTHSFEHACNR